MKVYIFGYNGNMAQRYRAILHSLGHKTGGKDLEGDRYGTMDDADAIIIATPTDTHAALLWELKDCGKPILCEKPITKDLAELEELVSDLKAAGTRLRMVDQYRYLIPKPWDDADQDQDTGYDYFKHGTDGLAWDCINLIYHARSSVDLHEESPIWSAKINGRRLRLERMDHAYIDMIEDWLQDGSADYGHILDAHRKVHSFERLMVFPNE